MENEYEVIAYRARKETVRYPTSAIDAGEALKKMYAEHNYLKNESCGICIKKLSKLEKS